MGALVLAVRHAMIVVFFFVVNKPALKKNQYAKVHHNTPPFIKIERLLSSNKCAMFVKMLCSAMFGVAALNTDGKTLLSVQ